MPARPASDDIPPSKTADKIIERASSLAFAAASFTLMALAAGLTLVGVYRVVTSALVSVERLDTTLLDAIGYIVIAIAVFDVSKYLLEEEVLRDREVRRASQARLRLTKFVSTIAIAVFLEALVVIFKTARDDPNQLLAPTFLLIGGVAMLVGLGVYQRLSALVEQEVEGADKRQAAHEDAQEKAEGK